MALPACALNNEMTKQSSLSIFALNHGQPFVSMDFAARLAQLVVDEKYPKDVLLVTGPPRVLHMGDTWRVVFDKVVPGPVLDSLNPGAPHDDGVARRLTVVIRKTNAEIVSIE
jgi:hypothetical protein